MRPPHDTLVPRSFSTQDYFVFHTRVVDVVCDCAGIRLSVNGNGDGKRQNNSERGCNSDLNRHAKYGFHRSRYPTSQFTQLMALLEFLADPTDYTKSEQVGRIIGRYVATNATEYEKFKARYYELSGKKDDATGEYVGYRTRIVHMALRLESILPAAPRTQLLKELDGYVRTVIDDMLDRSSWDYDSYLAHRDSMQPFLK